MKLELNKSFEKDKDQAELESQGIGVTPPIFGEYWMYRVEVSKRQAVIAFPKFFTIGIGFQVEDVDWNCNLPYTCDAVQIYEHIRHNRMDARRPKCIEAIKMLQAAISKDKEQAAS